MKFLVITIIGLFALHAYAEDERQIIRADFDSDGRPDVAISEPTTAANSGCSWKIYLTQPDGKLYSVGSLFFHPLAFHIVPHKNGGSNMTVYIRSSGTEGSLITYHLSGKRIKKTSSRVIHPGDGGTDEGRNVYDSYFSGLRDHPLHKALSDEELEKIKERIQNS